MVLCLHLVDEPEHIHIMADLTSDIKIKRGTVTFYRVIRVA